MAFLFAYSSFALNSLDSCHWSRSRHSNIRFWWCMWWHRRCISIPRFSY